MYTIIRRNVNQTKFVVPALFSIYNADWLPIFYEDANYKTVIVSPNAYSGSSRVLDNKNRSAQVVYACEREIVSANLHFFN